MTPDRGPALPTHLYLERGRAAELTAVLRRHGFVPEQLDPLQAMEAGRALPGHSAAVARACAALGALGTIVQLFVFDAVVAVADAASALAPIELDELVAGGLLERDGDVVRSAIRLAAFAEHIVATDRPARYGEHDYILQLTPSAIMLASGTMFPATGRVLDLACGAGIHAVVAAALGAEVTATDLNPRAALFTQLNAALNGVTIDSRTGDLWEPVGDDRFDLVVANAPFIISPDTDRIFLSAGMELDGFCRMIGRTVADHLTAGGVCQFMASWPQIAGEDSDVRVLSWFDGFAGDVWAMEFTRFDAVEHATAYIDAAVDPAFELQRWLDHFESHRMEGVVQGLVTARRGDGVGLRVVTVEPTDPAALYRDHLRTMFDARSRLASATDGWLLDQCLATSEDVWFVTEGSARNGTVSRVELQQRAGIPYRIDVHPAVLQLLSSCDGARTLREAIELVASAQRLGVEAVVSGLTDIAEQCLCAGMLLFADR